MNDGEHVGFAELICVGQVAFDERAQQVFMFRMDNL